VNKAPGFLSQPVSKTRWTVTPQLALLLWLLFAVPAQARDGTALFADGDTLAVTLRAAWSEFLHNTNSDERYPAVLEYRAEDGQRVQIPVTIERRGVTRRALCEFPPIRIRFDRAARATAQGTLFEGQNNLKMVTHCNPRRRWEQYYVMEMLAYRIYNQVTERSFRVRELSITYADDQRGRSDADRFAFLIEHVRDVASRNDLPRVRQAHVGSRSYEPDDISRFMLFQYLIGNTDFSVLTFSADERCCHNVRTLGTVEELGLYAVPYDFDSAGLVNASYAAPHESLPIRNVTRRLYRGLCSHNGSLPMAREEFLALEQTILGLIRDEPRLDAQNRRTALRYVDEFYKTIKDPNQFERNITASCRT